MQLLFMQDKVAATEVQCTSESLPVHWSATSGRTSFMDTWTVECLLLPLIGTQWQYSTLCSTELHSLALSGILWHRVAFYGTEWHSLAHSGMLWHRVAFYGTE